MGIISFIISLSNELNKKDSEDNSYDETNFEEEDLEEDDYYYEDEE